MAEPTELVFIGGGHTHVQVLKRWAEEPVPGVNLTVVLDRPVAVYSGMVPGFVAGDYEANELEIDVRPLADLAGARLILEAATRIDAAGRCVVTEGDRTVPYDLLSINVGSTVRGLDLEGVKEHTLPTRPIGRFVELVAERVQLGAGAAAEAPAEPGEASDALGVVIVGAGAGGVELAFTLRARILRATGVPPAVTIVAGSDDVLPGAPHRVVKRARRELIRLGVMLRLGERVTRVTEDAVHLESGDCLPQDLAVWVTGASAHPFLEASGLPTVRGGFVRVRSTLQVEGLDDVFAAGDCAFLVDHPWVPRAGVYAVREGPILDHNIRAKLAGEPLRVYTPQRDFLSLLNVGDGRAIGSKWGFAFAGRWVFRLKDRIDRAFVRRFQRTEA
ncbi:MAG: FAD-dependent oxidoreductase [Planctomycetota bacterium]